MNELDQAYANVYKIAQQNGARYPEIAASVYMLESAGGSSPSGAHNYYGQKASANEDGVSLPTYEYRNGRRITVNARFKNFKSLEESVINFVDKWDKDFTSSTGAKYSGFGSAKNLTSAIQELKNQGYATDPNYVDKIYRTARRYAHLNVKPKPKPKVPTVKPKPKTFNPLSILGKAYKGTNPGQYIF